MANTDIMTLPSPLSNLRQYLNLVEQFPRLSEEEERDLATRLQKEKDLQAAWRLVTSHLRFVVSIARGYRGYGLPEEDLIQEGNVGLMKAVQRFDPARGVRLAAYAVYWIRAHIHDFILKNWRIVKVATTKAKRKLFYKLRSTKKRLEWLNRSEADDIADALDVGADDVIEMEAQLYLRDQSFDPTVDASNDESWAPAAYLEDMRFEPETVVSEAEFFDAAASSLHEALDELDDRARDIVECRWLKDDDETLTLQALGERYGVSAERIRQIEAGAIRTLQQKIAPRLGHGPVGRRPARAA